MRRPDSNPKNLLPVGLITAIALFMHLLFNQGYDYFRDEFYYIACSKRLAWGYVDHPPLSIVLLALARGLLGDSLFAIRLLPALSHAMLVLMTGLLARDFGGNRLAQSLAALGSLIAPVYLVNTNFFSMNAFESLFWMGSLWLLINALRIGRPFASSEDSSSPQRVQVISFALFGLAIGLGALNKHSQLFFVFGLLVGLLFTYHRRIFLTPGPYLSAMIALAVLLPHLFWQYQNDVPTLEFMRNAQEFKNYDTSPLEFFMGQFLQMLPPSILLWMMGLIALLIWKPFQPLRFVGIAYLTLFLLFTLQQAKFYYLAPFYPVLFAAGAVALERFAEKGRRWLPTASMVLLSISGIVFAPVALPILSPGALIQYIQRLGIQEPPSEKHARAQLPQYFADMFGWRNLTETVARVYQSLPESERKQCALFTTNYGRAGALEFFGPAFGLPQPICGHNNYWLWGYGNTIGDVVIVVGVSEDQLRDTFEEVSLAATVTNEFSMPYENNLSVFVCKRLKQPIQIWWQKVKNYI